MIDALLVGTWDAGGSTPVMIDADGMLFSVADPAPFSLSTDDTTLTFPTTTPPTIFNRLHGSGSVLGLWERFETSGGITDREEWLFRADGSYTYHWDIDGVFDSEGMGLYQTSGGMMSTQERRASVTTGPGNQIVFAQFFGPVQIGSYSVAADGLSFTTVIGGKTTVYTKVPAA